MLCFHQTQQCRNRAEWLGSIRTFVLLGFFLISKSSDEQSVFISCSLWAAVEASWIVHVLFIPPLLLVASGWILVCPHGLFAAPWLVSVKGRERRMRNWEQDHPRVLSCRSQEPRKHVPDSRELLVAGFGWVWVAPFPVACHKALPMASPIELLGLGRAGWHLDFPVTLCSVWMCWEPLGYRDKVVVVQYYFPSACMPWGPPRSFVYWCWGRLGLKLLKWNNAASIYCYSPFSQSQDLGSLSSR